MEEKNIGDERVWVEVTDLSGEIILKRMAFKEDMAVALDGLEHPAGEKLKTESPMTEPNMEWEENFDARAKISFARGGFLVTDYPGENGENHWCLDEMSVKDFIRQKIASAETRAYEKGAAEEREQMVIAVEEIKKNISEMNDDSYINAKVDACNAFLSLLHHKK